MFRLPRGRKTDGGGQRSAAAKSGRAGGRRWFGRLLLAAAALGLLCVGQVVVLRFVAPPFTVEMAKDWILQPFADPPYRTPAYRWVALEEISVHLRRAVLAAEDQRFLQHNGFDMTEMKKAIDEALDGDRIRGASTISMQTARSVFLPESRSLARKIAEAGFTVLIEQFWGKPRILEMYLNTVDWGDGIVGAEAAARTYFNVPAASLTRHQAAALAAILPNPHRWSATRPGPYVRKRQQRILAQMAAMPLVR